MNFTAERKPVDPSIMMQMDMEESAPYWRCEDCDDFHRCDIEGHEDIGWCNQNYDFRKGENHGCLA